MNLPNCPFCLSPAERSTRFAGVAFCGRHGRFQWFDRAQMKNLDLLDIYHSYPYSEAIADDFRVMRPLYIKGLERRIRRHFPEAAGLRFLDVGCANGEYLDSARELGMTGITGVEVDEAARDKASRFGRVVPSLFDLEEGFDVVQCKNVLSNIQDFQPFFAKMLRLLRPDGVLFFDVLNQYSLIASVKRMSGKPGILRPPFVINGFSKKSVSMLAGKHNARILSLGTTYCGSALLPYRKNLSLTIRGILSRLLGAASMITADIKCLDKGHTF
jgi:SAM-dependent methyltransferase